MHKSAKIGLMTTLWEKRRQERVPSSHLKAYRDVGYVVFRACPRMEEQENEEVV